MNEFFRIFYIFVAYAFLGWCGEVAFAALKTGEFVNRGFLNGPYCPIYGAGAVLVVSALEPIQQNTALLFAGSAALTTLLELITGYVLEKLFHTRWWDYSGMPFNFKGYICLAFTLVWGFACTFIMRILHPAIMSPFTHLPFTASAIILCVTGCIMLADCISTIIAVRKLTNHLKLISGIAEELHKLSDELGEDIYDKVTAMETRSAPARERIETELKPKLEESKENYQQRVSRAAERIESNRKKLESMREKLLAGRQEKRLLKAFPSLRHIEYPSSVEVFKKVHARIENAFGKEDAD